MKKLLFLVILLLPLQQVFSKEGFVQKPSDKKFMNAWKNTFMYAVTKKNAYDFFIEKMGTVSVIYKKETSDGAYVGLLTNKHIVLSHQDFEGRLFKNMNYDTVIHNPSDVDEIDFQKTGKSYVNEKYDLGLIVIKVNTEVAKFITPILLTQKCNYGEGSPVSIIGFPAVMHRHPSDQIVPIVNPTTITKRMSEGQYVEDYITNESGLMVGTTADAMLGNSGSPVLDSKGDIMGVQAAVKFAGLKYHGRESRKTLIAHSWIVECQKTKDFAQKSWSEFLESI